MKNYKKSLVTLISASALVGLLSTSPKTIFADTTDQIQAKSDFNKQDNGSQKQTQNSLSLSDEAQAALKDANLKLDTLTNNQIREINKINFKKTKKNVGTQFTYQQYRSLAKKMINRDARYRVPYFNAKKIKNMPATYTRDAQTGKKPNLIFGILGLFRMKKLAPLLIIRDIN